jgi:IclR family pca regulon transcriptional regulator
MQPGDDPDLSEPRYSRSLGRGLAILGLFTQARPVMGVTEIANLLGLTPATTHRYVTTLLELGYLERNRSRKYQLSLRVLELGRAALGSTPLPEHARPVLEQLRTTGYTASLGVLDGADVLLIGRAASTRRGSRLIPDTAIGARLPAHCTSMGKVLLATLPDETWRSRLGDSPLAKHGPGTITSKRRLEPQLNSVRQQGYATNDQELWPEVLAVAVPVLDEYGEVTAALSLTAHRSMASLPTLIDAGAPPLVNGASRLSERLGHRAPDLTAAG